MPAMGERQVSTPPSPSEPRRRFLSWLGGASLLGIAGVPASAHAAEPFVGGLTPPPADPAGAVHPPVIAETWDMSWTDRMTGRYKAVFDSPDHADGAALYRAVSWTEHYKEVYGVERTELSPVLVLRHYGFFFAMNSDFWARHEIGKVIKMRDERGKKWARRNPLSVTDPAATAQARKFSLESFLTNGGTVLVCGWSFGGASQMIAKEEHLEREAARARAKEMLIPGVILQPNGIFAALRAQEAGCRYINAS
jgi:hypothetical protein